MVFFIGAHYFLYDEKIVRNLIKNSGTIKNPAYVQGSSFNDISDYFFEVDSLNVFDIGLVMYERTVRLSPIKSTCAVIPGRI